MQKLNVSEIEQVSGGVCEGLSLAACIDGVVDTFAGEVKAAAGYAEQLWQRWDNWNDFGIWLYNTLNC